MIDVDLVRQQIANLRLLYPELLEDEESWLLSIESETNVMKLLGQIERKRQEAGTFASAIDYNIGILKERQGRFARREEAMRDLAFRLMQVAEMKKAELPEATLSIRMGTPKVIITDEHRLPDIACRFKREPDKIKIRELLLRDPYIVAGAELSNVQPILSIRTK